MYTITRQSNLRPVLDLALAALLLAFSATSALAEDPIEARYQGGDYSGAIEFAENRLKEAPEDLRARKLMLAALLKLGDAHFARTLLDDLPNDRAHERFKQSAERILERFEARELDEAKIIAALAHFQTDSAIDVIRESHFTQLEKKLLESQILALSGRFSEALGAISGAEVSSYSQKKLLDDLTSRTREKAQRFEELWDSEIRFFVDSPESSAHWGYCTKSIPNYTLEDFVRVVDDVAQLAPLDGRVLDLIFLSSLFVTDDYEPVRRLGEAILSAKGSLGFWAHSRDFHYRLVVDSRQRTVSIQEQRPIETSFRQNLMGTGCKKSKQSYGNPLKPYRVSFDAIRSVEQHNGGNNSFDDSFIGFNGQHESGNLKVATLVFWEWGRAAESAVYRKLGRFFVDLFGVSAAKLVPERQDLGSGALALVFGAAYGLQALNQGTSFDIAAFQQDLMDGAKLLEEANAQNRERRIAWMQHLKSEEILSIDESRFESLEDLLGS
ncbi:MAG: hypothetical protein AAF481_16060 [Acidobacteriota bacterium]